MCLAWDLAMTGGQAWETAYISDGPRVLLPSPSNLITLVAQF